MANWLFWRSKLRGGLGPWIWTISCREGKGIKCFRCNSYSHLIILGIPRTANTRWDENIYAALFPSASRLFIGSPVAPIAFWSPGSIEPSQGLTAWKRSVDRNRIPAPILDMLSQICVLFPWVYSVPLWADRVLDFPEYLVCLSLHQLIPIFTM